MVLTALAPSQLAWDLPGAMLGTCPCARIRKPIWLRRVCVGALLTCTACQLVLWMLWAVSAATLLVYIGAFQSAHLARLRCERSLAARPDRGPLCPT